MTDHDAIPPYALRGPIVIADVAIATDLADFIAAKVAEAIYAGKHFSPQSMAYIASLKYIAHSEHGEVVTPVVIATCDNTEDENLEVLGAPNEHPGVGVAMLMSNLGISRSACTRKFRSGRWPGWKDDEGNWQMNEENYQSLKEARRSA